MFAQSAPTTTAIAPVPLAWTSHDDAALLEAARQSQGLRGHHDWDVVSRLLAVGGVVGRSANACRTRFHDPEIRGVRDKASQGVDWDAVERKSLWDICQKFPGKKNWHAVQREMRDQNYRGRTAEMCRHQYNRIQKGRVNTNPKKQTCRFCGLPRAGHFCKGRLLDAAVAPAPSAL